MANAGEVKIILAADAATYTAALQKARAQLNQLTGDAARASVAGQKLGKDLSSAGHMTVQPWMASSAALRLLEGDITNNIRAGERFVAAFKPLQNILRDAFPLIGALALTGIVVELGEKIANYRREMELAAQKAQTVWRTVDAPIRAAADDLQVANDKIADAIAKLEGRPRNGIKDAIDEAIDSAGKLGDKLNDDIAKIAQTLKEQQVGFWAQAAGAAPTSDITKRAWSLQMQLQDMQRSGEGTLDVMGRWAGPKEVDAERQRLTQQYSQTLQKEIEWATQQLETAKNRGTMPMGGPITPILRGTNQQERIRDLSGYLYGLTQLQRYGREFNENVALTDKRGDLESQKAVEEASRRALEPLKRAIAEIGAMAKENESQVAEYARTAGLIAPKPMFDVFGKAQQIPPGIGPDTSDLSRGEDFARGTEQRGRDISTWLRQMNEGVTIGEKNADAMARVSIEIERMTGRISDYDAVQATAALHAQEFADEMRRLDGAQRAIEGNPALSNIERSGQLQAVANQRATAVGAYDVTQAQDDAAARAATGLGALREATDRLAQAFQNMPQHLVDLMGSTINGFNSTFSDSIMAPARSGREYRRNMENAFAGQFRSLGSKGLESALQLGEGSLLKKFGFGGKADGSQSNPYWVRMAGSGASGAASSAASSVLSAFSTGGSSGVKAVGNALSTELPQLLTLIPMMAAGGDLSSNMPAIVGERGPELFMPATSGRIIPNDRLGGGGGDLHLHVDARGAMDPAAVGHQIHMAVTGLREQVPAIALAAHRQFNRMRPGTSHI